MKLSPTYQNVELALEAAIREFNRYKTTDCRDDVTAQECLKAFRKHLRVAIRLSERLD